MRLTLRTARLGAAVALVTFTFFAASCGSSTEPQPAPTTQPAGHGSYASCLAANGVQTPPAGPAAPPGVDPQTWAKAQQACADKAPGPAS
ncbi:hypothetical protein [Mycolicibacterium sp. P9-64]|uniref:hypothetical protein n=1 Tax=Mycolicibacterium sp. P9-64 TaxID=2024612 RepID=UPI001F5BB8C7|nr:hypothetical protein [Mycolicibacterium sp. P9-64]